MTDGQRTAAVTGAYGYVGSLLRARLQANGWRTMALVRAPRGDDPLAAAFDLAGDPPSAALASVDLLVHAAYDLSLVGADDIERVNVDGSRRLLQAAAVAGVARTVVISSMSAYPGTRQLYGRAKLAIEGHVHDVGGCAVRPGLVYGPRPGGMAAGLARVATAAVTPVLAGRRSQYVVHEDDLAGAVSVIAAAREPPPAVISVAHPTKVELRSILRGLAASQGRRCRFVPVPGAAVYGLLRAGERLGIALPFRSDSFLGLLEPAPRLVGDDYLRAHGVTVRPFASTLGESAVPPEEAPAPP